MILLSDFAGGEEKRIRVFSEIIIILSDFAKQHTWAVNCEDKSVTNFRFLCFGSQTSQEAKKNVYEIFR